MGSRIIFEPAMTFDGESFLGEAERAASGASSAEGESRNVLSLVLEDESYGLQLGDVREVAKVSAVTPVPGLPSTILGAMNLRGEILPIADVRPLLGLSQGRVEDTSRLVVVSSSAGRIGLLVDAIGDILDVRVPSGAPSAPEFVLFQAVRPEGLLSVLDLPRILSALLGT